MEPIVQRLQIETLKAQLALFKLGHAYLAGRCDSVEEMTAETFALLTVMHRAKTETSVLQAELDLAQGRIRPVWG